MGFLNKSTGFSDGCGVLPQNPYFFYAKIIVILHIWRILNVCTFGFCMGRDSMVQATSKKKWMRKWKPELAIVGYELARDGLKLSQIAKVLNISKPTIDNWIQTRPTFRFAIRRGRRWRKESRKCTYDMGDYVYDRLSEPMRLLWHKLDRMHRANVGIEKVEAMFANYGKDFRQHLFLCALVKSAFSIAAACRKVGIKRATFQTWYLDSDFQKLVREIEDIKDDMFESSLIRKVLDGSEPAILAVARSRLKKRGYGDRASLDVNVQGQIDHNHKMFPMESLNLPLPIQKQILAHLRTAKAIDAEVVA